MNSVKVFKVERLKKAWAKALKKLGYLASSAFISLHISTAFLAASSNEIS